MEESPEGNGAARCFNYFMVVLIIVNVLAVLLETVRPLEKQYFLLFSIIDIVSISIFTVEYLIRLWICTLNPDYSHPVTGRLRYMVSGYALIDLFAFLPFYIPAIIPVDLRFIRILRLFRLIRVMKLGRYSKAMKTFSVVIKKTREELLLALSILLIVIVLASTLMYYAENGAQPDKFDSIPAAMWWAVVTLATVGYGDIYPVTTLGKVIGGLVVVIGIMIFALPAAILSAGFIGEIQEKRVVICPACGHRIGGDPDHDCNGEPPEPKNPDREPPKKRSGDD
jgi:voltage-gated potassium channel